MRGKQKHHLFIVKMPALMSKRQSQSYVLSAVRTEGGHYGWEHPFYRVVDRKKIVVKPCLYDIEQDNTKQLKAKVKAYFTKNELPSGIYCDIMEIFDKHLEGAS